MKKIVFYSWQSDLPNSTNRSFLENALKRAALEIEHDGSIDIEPVIDRDTRGIAGAPDIASTIFAKITAADLVVADISIVSKQRGKRATPNPNVLIELGYALKTLGHERIVLVFNKAFGKIEDVPFDLKMRRMIPYELSEGLDDSSIVKKELINNFKAALISGLANVAKEDTSTEILKAIENQLPNKIIIVRKYSSSFLLELEKIKPKMFRDGGTTEELIGAISKTQPILAEFAKISETIALMNDMEAAKEIFKGFGKIYEKYYPEPNQSGLASKADGDFFKFIGHELFVIFTTPFLKEEKWSNIKEILSWNFKSENKRYGQGLQKISWTELNDYSPLLADESKKRNRIDLRADILKDRHISEGLASVAPFREFSDTDLFLYLYGEAKSVSEYHPTWYPVSITWLDHTPAFIGDAEDYTTGMEISNALNISDIDELKRRLYASNKLQFARFSPIVDNDIKKIGSKGGGQIITNVKEY